jgi:hypothetical protein
MFDFIGDYVSWTHQDGWTVSTFVFLGLGLVAVALVVLLVLFAVGTLLRALGGGFRSGLTEEAGPTKTEWLEAEKQRRQDRHRA